MYNWFKENKKLKHQLMSWGFNGFGLLGRWDNADIPKRIKDLNLRGQELWTYIPNLPFDVVEEKYGSEESSLLSKWKKGGSNA